MRSVSTVIVICLIILSGCEDRATPTRGQAMAIAGNYLTARDLDWGPVKRVWAPNSQDPHYKDYWQIDFYGPTSNGRPAVVVVDIWSSWARLPPKDYVIRKTAQTIEDEEPPNITIVPGSWILVLEEEATDEVAQLAAQTRIDHWNQLAKKDGVPQRFSLRQPRNAPEGAGLQLIYGWDGSQGMVREGSLTSWVRETLQVQTAKWVNLAGSH